MTKYFLICFFIGFPGIMFTQNLTIEAHYLRGSTIIHNPELAHLTNSHPRGSLFSLSWKPDGSKEWHHALNFPDYGINIHHLNYNLETVGENFSLGFFYQFYFLNRHLSFRLSQGIGYNTNPYDKILNPKNNAFGSSFLSNTLFKLQFQKEQLWHRIGFQTGITFSHFSNARLAAPNSGLNVISAHIGLQYHLHEHKIIKQDTSLIAKKKEPIKYQLALRSGANVGPIEGMPLRPFVHTSFIFDKRLNRYSALQLGVDYFWSEYLKDVINYYSVAVIDPPNLNPNTNVTRFGLFIGHEWFLNKFSLEKQLGTYLYKSFDYESAVYLRLAIKYYLSNKVFTSVGLKSHGFRAEVMEVGLGVRL